MFAVSLDNLLFFLLIAVAALFQLLSKTISKAGKSDSNETSSSPRPQTPRPIQRAPRESDADRIRKFLEALGQPPTSTPPPPVAPRTDVPPRTLAPVQPPPGIPGAWRLPRERREKPDVTQKESPALEQPSRLQQIVPPPVPPPAAPAFEVHEALAVELQQPPIIKTPVEAYAATTQAVAKRADFTMNITTLLVSKSGLREAILLREILGPPRGLQAFDLL
ncbi:MAG: hypothetical protein ABJB70_01690 [Candidatus Udaeobacter sp.]